MEILDRSEHDWLSDVSRALERHGVVFQSISTEPEPSQTLVPVSPGLPTSPTAFIGGEHEVSSICSAIRRSDARLLTLTGPGGVGKTRLALEAAAQVASDFPDGVAFVPLAQLADPNLVGTTIAQFLELREIEHVLERLRAARCLLVLDNFEQVADAAPLVGQILTACTQVSVLVTSRGPLRTYGEHEFPVAPLTLPETDAEAETPPDALRLFAERARAVRPDFVLTMDNVGDVAAICRRLDGLPLAIELAAARIRLFTPAALRERIDRPLVILTGRARDLPSRQQTLRAAIAWSYGLLTPKEQSLFRRLSVFVGGFDLADAEAVCEATGELSFDLLDGLDALVGQSLVRVEEESSKPKFLLLETIRAFGLEQLEASGDAALVRAAHASYFLRYAEKATPPKTSDRTWTPGIDRVSASIDNLRSALDFLLSRGDTVSALRLATALEESLDILRRTHDPMTLGMSLAALAYIAAQQADHAGARRLIGEVLAVARRRDRIQPTCYGLDAAAVLAAATGDPGRAARLQAASMSLRASVKYACHPIWRTLQRRARVPVERPDGNPALVSAWDTGLSMSPVEAVDDAVNGL